MSEINTFELLASEIGSRCGEWTGRTWDDEHIDAMRRVVEKIGALSISEDELDSCRHNQTDGSHAEERIADRSQNAIRKIQVAISELCEGMAELDSIADELDAKIEADAAEAESLACEAAARLEEGEVGEAIELLDQASSVENRYGDCPTWGPVYQNAKSLLGH